MSFDDVTGDLWVGDVGWEMYEMVYRVRSGGNYGWSIKEGPGDVRPNLPLGPTPILRQTSRCPCRCGIGHGGFVYRGKRFPDLHGRYIFGDWITRRFWAVPFDRNAVGAPTEIASTHVKPICFAIDHDGELLVLDYSNVGQKSRALSIRKQSEVDRVSRERSSQSIPLSHQSVGIVLGYQEEDTKEWCRPLQAQRDHVVWMVPSLSTCSPSLGKDKPFSSRRANDV